MVVNVDTTGAVASDLSGNCFTISGQFGIGGYAHGAPPTVYPGQAPLKAGVRIKAGSKIILQIHYPMGTVGQIDSTQIRMYFYPVGTTGIRTIYNTVPLQHWGLSIPPNMVKTYSAQYPPSSGGIPFTISMFSAFPHSHKLCKSIVNYAFQATDTIPIIRINNWDFDWQGYYTCKKLLKISAGYKLYSTHVYDNTTDNENNPNNPPVHVYAGSNTTDEMFFDAFQWLLYQPGDELIDIEALLNNDSLLNNHNHHVGVNEVSSPKSFNAYVYPNPATDKVNIYLSKKSEYKTRLLNVTGQAILNPETLFSDETVLDVKSVPAGMYIIEIINVKTNERVTKKIVIENK